MLTYNITEIIEGEDTTLFEGQQYAEAAFDKMKVDGVTYNYISSTWRFETTGTHIVEFSLSGTRLDNLPMYPSTLTSIKIPENVEYLGNGSEGNSSPLSAAFNDGDLVSVTVEATVPPVYDEFLLDSRDFNKPIYVPASSVDAYKAASGWSDYASLIQAIQS